MSDFIVAPGTAAAQLDAVVAFADAGGGNSYTAVYDASDLLLTTLLLSKPCGVVTAGVLRLTQQLPGGDMIVATGQATHADWFAGHGPLVAQGAVTDESGTGPFTLGGTAGTQMYTGGRAILGETEIT